MESGGYYAGFYTSASHAASVVSEEVRKRYAAWIAQWSSKCTYSGQYGIWQYSSDGSVNGISGSVDMDMSYVDYPSVIKSGYNGYSKTNATAKKTVDELAKEVIAGSWGNGDEGKSRLTAAGYDYDAVQKKVNELCGVSSKKTVTELAKEVIAGKAEDLEEVVVAKIAIPTKQGAIADKQQHSPKNYYTGWIKEDNCSEILNSSK